MVGALVSPHFSDGITKKVLIILGGLIISLTLALKDHFREQSTDSSHSVDSAKSFFNVEQLERSNSDKMDRLESNIDKLHNNIVLAAKGERHKPIEPSEIDVLVPQLEAITDSLISSENLMTLLPDKDDSLWTKDKRYHDILSPLYRSAADAGWDDLEPTNISVEELARQRQRGKAKAEQLGDSIEALRETLIKLSAFHSRWS